MTSFAILADFNEKDEYMEQHDNDLLMKELNGELGWLAALILLLVIFGFGSKDKTEK